MTLFIGRSGWGALPPNRPSPDRTETTHVHIHHSGTPKPRDIADARSQLQAIQRDHLHRPISPSNPTLWADVAYNIPIGPGVLLEGRGWDARGGGTGPGEKVPHPSGSWDNVSISLCVLGNYDVDVVDDLTRQTIIDALRECIALYGPDLIVQGDRDVNFTKCCGDNLYPLIPELWAEALGDDDMTLAELTAAFGPLARLENGVIQIKLRDGQWHSLSEAFSWTHEEAQDAANNVASSGVGGVTAGQVADELGRRLKP